MTHTDRLIFGTSRLTGGIDAKPAAALAEAAYAAGFREFDTAPSYGIGTAEAVLGAAFAGDLGIKINTKIGSARPRHPFLKSFARRVKRTLNGNVTQAESKLPPPQSNLAGGKGNFAQDFAEQSLEQSLKALRRRRVDLLMYHEIALHELDDTKITSLRKMRDAGTALEVGFSNSGRHETGLAALPSDLGRQTAVDPNMFLTSALASSARTNIHGVVPVFRHLAATDLAIQALLLDMAMLVDAQAEATLVVAIPYAMLLQAQPGLRPIYTSSSRLRLDSFRNCLDRLMDHAGVAARIARHYERNT